MLSQGEAAEILGVSERTFRSWRDAAGGGRVVRPPPGPGPGADELAQVLELTRYFNARHEKLVACHGAGLCPADLATPTSRHYSRLPVPACGCAEFATAAHGTARNLRFRGKSGKQLPRSMDEIRSRGCPVRQEARLFPVPFVQDDRRIIRSAPR